MTDFERIVERFRAHLLLEGGLARNTLDAYTADVTRLQQWCAPRQAADLTDADVADFVHGLGDAGIAARSQARIISGLKSFFRFLVLEGYRADNPSALIEAPSTGAHLPEVLTVDEINAMVDSVDTSSLLGIRNRAIIEFLYGSGLRVSELCTLEWRRVFPEQGLLTVTGKGSKERMVPVSPEALEWLARYSDACRREGAPIKPGNEDYVFLNRRGARLTRVMVFYIVRDLAAAAGIRKTISPHTLRHSFATHLIEGGANLRAIQQMLGHESIATTEIYLRLDTTLLREEILMHHPRNRKGE